MDNIYIGFCISKFIDFNKFINYVNVEGGKCVYIFDSIAPDTQKLNTLYKIAKKINIYKDSSSMESKINTNGKINTIHLYLNQSKNIKTIIKYTNNTNFIFYLDKCDISEYKNIINTFHDVKNIIILGEKMIDVIKKLISQIHTCDDLIKYADFCKKFKCNKHNDFYIWTNIEIVENDKEIENISDNEVLNKLEDLNLLY